MASFNPTLFLNIECAKKYKDIIEKCPILPCRSVAWGELEPLGLEDLFEHQGLLTLLGLNPQYCELAVRHFYSNFSLTIKHKDIVGFKSYIRGKKISMNLQEFSDLMEIPLGGLDIYGCSAVRADFGFTEDVVQQTLFLNPNTPLFVSNASHYRLPVRVANRIVAFNLINKAGNFDDIHENVRAILTCIMKKSKIDWIKYILRTIGRPNLRSLSYASLISNLIHLKDIPTGNWALTNPSVNPFNMGAINKMLVANTIETIRELVYYDPPSSELVFSEKVVELLRDAKAELVVLGKNVDHIPDYRTSSKRKLRKFIASTSSAPPPPPTSEAPPSPPPAAQTAPSAPRREDRILDAMAAMTVKQENYAKFMHDGMLMIHEENTYLAKKFEDFYSHHQAVTSLQDPPPPTAPGFPFYWPPTSYYVAFPTTARTDDAPGGSGAGPSSAGGDDVPGSSGGGVGGQMDQ